MTNMEPQKPKLPRTMTPAQAKEVRKRLPEVCQKVDDLLDELGYGRKFKDSI